MYKEIVGKLNTYRIHDTGLVETTHGMSDFISETYKSKKINKRNTFRKLYTFINNRGYNTCHIFNKTKMIHRLVAENFIPNPENKKYINHIDGNKLNNNKDNLEWSTNSENVKHAIKTGLMTKEGRARSKKNLEKKWEETRIPIEIVREIRSRFKKRCKINGSQPMSKEFGISTTTISYIVNYKKHFANIE